LLCCVVGGRWWRHSNGSATS